MFVVHMTANIHDHSHFLIALFYFSINIITRMEMFPVFLPPLETLVSMTAAVGVSVDRPLVVLPLPTMGVLRGPGTMSMDPLRTNKVHLPIRVDMEVLIICRAHILPLFLLVDLKVTMVVGEDIIRDRGGINSHAGEEIREGVSTDLDLLYRIRDMGDLVLKSLLIRVMITLLVEVVVTVMGRMDILLNMEIVIPTAVMMRMVMHLLHHLIRVEITVMYLLSFLPRVRCPMACIRLRSILVDVEIVVPIWMGRIHHHSIPQNVLVVRNL